MTGSKVRIMGVTRDENGVMDDDVRYFSDTKTQKDTFLNCSKTSQKGRVIENQT